MTEKTNRSRFSGQFWLAIFFEFMERGSYYGMMSILSVHLTENLHFAKEGVGLIKGTIQPILYFLPILSGALADRFGYRRTLTLAFALLGSGYLLTSQMTGYTAVFLALCVMALGAGMFKPLISGSIARLTDASNSSTGFGVYYWSINLGAFLFPLFLVPWLKTVPSSPPWKWVMIAAALGTGLMVIPTFLFYKDKRTVEEKAAKRANLLQTVADAFEIIYSPLVLLYNRLRKMPRGFYWTVLILITFACVFLFQRQGPFLLFYVLFLLAAGLVIPGVNRSKGGISGASPGLFAVLLLAVLWLFPGLSLFGRIVSSVIWLTALSLFFFDASDPAKFRDHFSFLLMVFIYSGFWILYFQMFDSVLWYVRDYVDAASLDRAVNRLLGAAGISLNWHFDIEHVTVINAGTIILLQLLISRIVKNKPALPTMMAGILLGTAGMAVLSISTHIWVFMTGIMIFSIGEMTAHPKFYSYIGLTAPKDRLATYMGYAFLYGVIGAGIGAPLGAKLYVHFVDGLHQPRVLWLIFSGIGLATLAGLGVYNRWIGRRQSG